MPLPVSIREQIIVALIAALNVTNANRPIGLNIYRERTRAIEVDALPSIFVYADDEAPKPLGQESYAAPLTERQLSLSLECRAQAVGDVTADETLDPVLVWAALAVKTDERFGGLASGVEEGRTVWISREADSRVAAAKWSITIRYRTSRLDPTSKS